MKTTKQTLPFVRLKFSLGNIVITRGALESLDMIDVYDALRRHGRGDWGLVDNEDMHSNNRALEHGERLLSVYQGKDGERFWIITEWDRSVTTVLLPDEY